MDGQVSRSEGTSVTINCTYSISGYPNLFWYVQYLGEGPELLLKAMKANDKGTNKGFEATYNTETTSFHLEKDSGQESDMTEVTEYSHKGNVYFLFLCSRHWYDFCIN